VADNWLLDVGVGYMLPSICNCRQLITMITVAAAAAAAAVYDMMMM